MKTITFTEQSLAEALGNVRGIHEMSVELTAASVFEQASAAQSAPVVPEGSIYVECRQCDKCQHVGINDAAHGVAACHDCDWSGNEPEDDKCPGCKSENCMAAACPECGARYALIASEDVAAAPAQPEAQEPYPHDHPLHKAVFMARESYTGGETFEEGVRGLIAELKDARKAQGEVQMLREALEHCSEVMKDPWKHGEGCISRAINRAAAALAASTGQEVGK